MEFLKSNLIVILVSLIFIQGLSAQDYNTELKAFQESYLLEASGETQKAVDALKKVYRGNSYEINVRLGWLSYQSGVFTESLAYYSKAISLKPLSIEAKFGYIYPASAMGNWDQVVNQYKKILEVTPGNTVANHRLGLIYYGREEYDKAYKLFEKVVNLFPFDHDALLMFGWTNLKMNKVREAKILFQKALLNTPGGSSALEGLEQVF